MDGGGGAGPATFPEPAPLLPLTPPASLSGESGLASWHGGWTLQRRTRRRPRSSARHPSSSVAVSLRSPAHARATLSPQLLPLPRLLPEPTPNPRAPPSPTARPTAVMATGRRRRRRRLFTHVAN